MTIKREPRFPWAQILQCAFIRERSVPAVPDDDATKDWDILNSIILVST